MSTGRSSSRSSGTALSGDCPSRQQAPAAHACSPPRLAFLVLLALTIAVMGMPVVEHVLAHAPTDGNGTAADTPGARRALHKVAMNGACAVVARSNLWTKDIREIDAETGKESKTGAILKSSAKWDYRIKVDPWRLFGQVELDIIGTDIVVEHVWAADVLEIKEIGGRLGAVGHHGVRVRIELGSTPQDDQQFDIDGTGTPTVAPSINLCRHLDEPVSECALGADFSELNNFEGVLSGKVAVGTWQQDARVTLDFDQAVSLSDVWGAQPGCTRCRILAEPGIHTGGAQLVEEAEGVVTATFKLLPFNHHTPMDRRSSFGFEATPPFHSMPFITCVPTKPLPPPPPPKPPQPPPSPPPYMAIERSDCFLGGRAVFTTTPSETPGMQWGVLVSLDRWLPGATVTVNFVGARLKEHPLRLFRIEPEDAVAQLGATSHSATLELRPTAVHEFSMLAYGLAESLGRLTCCCADSPAPPPPPPRPGRPPPPPPPPPPTPPPPPGDLRATHLTTDGEREIYGGGGFDDDDEGGGGGPGAAASLLALGALLALAYRKRRPLRAAALRKLGLGGGADDDDAGARLGLSGGGDDAADGGGEAHRAKLQIELAGGEKHSVLISLDGVADLPELQAMVADLCDELGHDQLNNLAMYYKKRDGTFATVTRAVSMDALRASPVLRLAPAAPARKATRTVKPNGRTARYGKV